MKQPCVYIMASKRHGTLYTGVTANLPGAPSSTARWRRISEIQLKILVWFDCTGP